MTWSPPGHPAEDRSFLHMTASWIPAFTQRRNRKTAETRGEAEGPGGPGSRSRHLERVTNTQEMSVSRMKPEASPGGAEGEAEILNKVNTSQKCLGNWVKCEMWTHLIQWVSSSTGYHYLWCPFRINVHESTSEALQKSPAIFMFQVFYSIKIIYYICKCTANRSC